MYLVYTIFISVLIYPVSGHWTWGGGWLMNSEAGSFMMKTFGTTFHDFAGSTIVHSVGGWIALVGAAILGPRIGKYDKNGNPHAIPGHNLTAGALGVFILWFCWFGFNGGSSLSLATDEAMTLTGLRPKHKLAEVWQAISVIDSKRHPGRFGGYYGWL